MPTAQDYFHRHANTDFREHPEMYRVGIGEQGVLIVQPYKGEILPFWRFATPEQARVSADKIFELFERYKNAKDFVGMDMARKFLQMGYTRSRRYANHEGGKKYDGPVPADKKGQSGAHGRAELPRSKTPDKEKVESASIFKAKWDAVSMDPTYQWMRRQFMENSGEKA